jgi:hypothetical protein
VAVRMEPCQSFNLPEICLTTEENHQNLSLCNREESGLIRSVVITSLLPAALPGLLISTQFRGQASCDIYHRAGEMSIKQNTVSDGQTTAPINEMIWLVQPDIFQSTCA